MPRVFIAKFEDREVSVEIEAAGPSVYKVRIDGHQQTIDARRLGPSRVSLLIEGQSREVNLARGGDDFDCLIANQRFRFRLLSEERARRAAARAGQEHTGRREVRASMPGKVVDVLVKIGDAVEAKQGLLIIEAMKMENEIKTPGAGEIKEVHVKAGQAVEAGEVLVVVE